MCRSIKTLYHLEPPAGETEIQEAALQYVRKISGFNRPSQANRAVFDAAVAAVAAASKALIGGLETAAPPRSRTVVAVRSHRFTIQER
ncbi:uncharacterized conserved protein [Longilinea arvoryzae]|uniref:Uncharacterized conserved protein n=1 Tax=Longilinea arvoryzae TaxID=360412 RepID=A0A0S7B794_9CHLR|nr:DUF2277 domain-containing protein [Longilinea arvoryzae]GAP13015.1 uncharacterized conserved protein [Longilinea arvoryzae]